MSGQNCAPDIARLIDDATSILEHMGHVDPRRPRAERIVASAYAAGQKAGKEEAAKLVDERAVKFKAEVAKLREMRADPSLRLQPWSLQNECEKLARSIRSSTSDAAT